MFSTSSENFKRYSSIIGCILMMISLSSVALAATCSPYYISYIRAFDNSDVRYSQILWMASAFSVVVSLSATLSGILMNRFKLSLKMIAIIGSLFFSSGFIVMSRTVTISFLAFLSSYALLFGTGFGMTYMIPFSIAMKWFPKSKGMASSVVFIGFGLGDAFFNELVTYYINPENYSPDEPYSPLHPDEKYFSKKDIDLLNRVPSGFFFTGVIIFTLSIIANILMIEKSDNVNNENIREFVINEQSPLINEDIVSYHLVDPVCQYDQEEDEEEKTSKIVEKKMTMKDALKSRELYLLVIMYNFYLIPTSVFGVNFKNFGQVFIHDDKFLSLISALAGLGNSVLRFLVGFMIDRHSFKMNYLLINSSTMVLLLTVYFNFYIGSKILYFFHCMAIFLMNAGMLILLPNGLEKCFGNKNIQLSFGLIHLFGIPISLIPGFLSPIVNSMGYFGLFSISCSFTAIAWVTAIFFNKKNEQGEDV